MPNIHDDWDTELYEYPNESNADITKALLLLFIIVAVGCLFI